MASFDSSRLGRRIGDYCTNYLYAAAGALVGIVCLVIAITGMQTTEHLGYVDVVNELGPTTRFFVAILGVVALIYSYLSLGKSLQVFEQGFVLVTRAGEKHVRWEEIARINHTITRALWLYFIPSPFKKHTFAFTLTNAANVSFDNTHIANGLQAGQTIERLWRQAARAKAASAAPASNAAADEVSAPPVGSPSAPASPIPAQSPMSAMHSLATADIMMRRGRAMLAEQRFSEALESFQLVVEAEPQNASAWNNVAVALKRLGRPEEALAAYDRALAADPNNVNAWNGMGVLLKDLGRQREALEALDRALALDPGDMLVQSNRNALLASMDQQ